MTEFAGFQRGSPRWEILLVPLGCLSFPLGLFGIYRAPCCEVCKIILNVDKAMMKMGKMAKMVKMVKTVKTVKTVKMVKIVE